MKLAFPVRGGVALRAAAVLAAVLMLASSVFALFRLREKDPTRQQCISNLKQVVMAFKTYLDDYDSRFPYVGTGAFPNWTPRADTLPYNGTIAVASWPVIMGPYVKTAAILACPKAGATTSKPFSYFYNRRLSGKSEGAVRYPANCIVLGDWVTYGLMNPGPADSTTWDIARSKQALPTGSWLAGQRHGRDDSIGGAVYAFADGNAKLLRRPDILPGNTVNPPPGIDTKPSFYP